MRKQSLYRVEPMGCDKTGTLRFMAISNIDDTVIADAHGAGFKSIASCHRGATYALRDKRFDAEKKKLAQNCMKWWNAHPKIRQCCTRFSREIAQGQWGRDDKFNLPLFRQILSSYNITENDLPYPSKALYKVFIHSNFYIKKYIA